MSARITATVAGVLALAVLLLPVHETGQVSCRPNIFGGVDCSGRDGRPNSQPNVFGGFDTRIPDDT